MLAAKKRKILTTNKQNVSVANSMESGIESDFAESVGDFSLPPPKRKTCGTRQVSFSINNKRSIDSCEFQQTASGYGSLLSTTLSPHKSHSGTPKKRKSETTDENAFYNSLNFVSPLKIRKTDEKRAKLILKDKCPSENVILSSTPIRSNKNKIWGKFRSLHQEKFEFGSSVESPTLPPLAATAEASFEACSFDFSGSFNLSECHDKDSPSGDLQNLLEGPFKLEPSPPANASPAETITQSSQGNLSASSTGSIRTRCYHGKLTLDILGKLHEQQNLALEKILNHLDNIDLLSLSHVSKEYRNMIKLNKTQEPKRQNYLKAFRKEKENKSLTNQTLPAKFKVEKKKPFDANVNHSMQLRPKPQSPPVSPSRRKFHENQKVARSHVGALRRCPRCSKPATVKTTKIRTSPRKKKTKTSILKLSPDSNRVQKKYRTFLSKPSIESPSMTEALFTTFPHSDSDASNFGSPSTSSDDSSCEMHETETYEFAECSGNFCSFKFCVKCLCKFHPRQRCKDLSPASPSRDSFNKSSVACSNKSLKSLKRLVY